MEKGVDAAIEGLKKSPSRLRIKIAQVASISAMDETVGNMIAEVMEEVGKDGVITVKKASPSAWKRKWLRACNLIRAMFRPI